MYWANFIFSESKNMYQFMMNITWKKFDFKQKNKKTNPAAFARIVSVLPSELV